jgi:hypothetical protein
MTVADGNRRVSPGELLRAAEVARAQRAIERRQRLKQAREWAEERAKVALDPSDPAFWYVMQKIRDDQANGYKVREPWCFEGRLKIHLAKFHEAAHREAGLVYYIRVGKFIKIGTSKDVDKRLKSYPPGAKLLATEPGGYQREAERHAQFAAHLAERKEWFTPGPELMTHIKNLQRHTRAELRNARAK